MPDRLDHCDKCIEMPRLLETKLVDFFPAWITRIVQEPDVNRVQHTTDGVGSRDANRPLLEAMGRAGGLDSSPGHSLLDSEALRDRELSITEVAARLHPLDVIHHRLRGPVPRVRIDRVEDSMRDRGSLRSRHRRFGGIATVGRVRSIPLSFSMFGRFVQPFVSARAHRDLIGDSDFTRNRSLRVERGHMYVASQQRGSISFTSGLDPARSWAQSRVVCEFPRD